MEEPRPQPGGLPNPGPPLSEAENPPYSPSPPAEETGRKTFPWTNLVLFLVTIYTTLLAGAFQYGVNAISNPMGLILGIPFSFTLMAILLTHEMGHYLASRYHRVKATLPYFIPGPTIIGTFGAFIRMTSPITNKNALLDIGAAGPIAGFVVTIPAIAIGLMFSTVTEKSGLVGMQLGSPLLFNLISDIVLGPIPDHLDVLLHPIAFAGWIGLFITALNLIPIGQLDGGHIVYSILGPWHRWASLGLVPILIIMGFLAWPGWFVWAVLPLIFGVRHPPLIDAHTPLDRRRRIIGWISLGILIVSFTPNPFMM
ncbi:MAG TPA: site-2 protease family protein [Nitrospiria bacterium]